MIGKHPHGVTLNPMVFLMDSTRTKTHIFESISKAKEYLKSMGVKSFKGLHFEEIDIICGNDCGILQ